MNTLKTRIIKDMFKKQMMEMELVSAKANIRELQADIKNLEMENKRLRWDKEDILIEFEKLLNKYADYECQEKRNQKEQN